MTKTYTTTYIFTLCTLLFVLPYTSNAFFDEDAYANSSSFAADTFAIETDTDNMTTELADSGTASVSFETETLSTISAQYKVTAEATSCDSAFYNGITITAYHEGVERYSGPLSGLQATSSSEGSWTFEMAASSLLSAQDNDQCEMTLTVDGWQVVFAEFDDGGFSDTKEATLTVTADGDIGSQETSTVVLNEIYPAPTSTTTEPLEREWIELYNGTDAAVDVEGWLLGEEIGGNGTTTTHHISASNTCASGSKEGFARPYDGSGTLIPSGGLLVVEFCAEHRLHNDGDTVSLYVGTTSSAIDMHTYPETDEGKSHARIPDGSQWVDPAPTPGAANTATREELLAEGWSEQEIERVLELLGKKKDRVNEKAKATTTTASETSETDRQNESENKLESKHVDDQTDEIIETATTTATTTNSTTTPEEKDREEDSVSTSTATTTIKAELSDDSVEDDARIESETKNSTEKEAEETTNTETENNDDASAKDETEEGTKDEEVNEEVKDNTDALDEEESESETSAESKEEVKKDTPEENTAEDATEEDVKAKENTDAEK